MRKEFIDDEIRMTNQCPATFTFPLMGFLIMLRWIVI